MRLVAVSLLLAGCINPFVPGDDPSIPPPPLTPPPPPVATGTYQIHTQLDLTVEALLPEPAEQLVVTLRDFSTAPAH